MGIVNLNVVEKKTKQGIESEKYVFDTFGFSKINLIMLIKKK